MHAHFVDKILARLEGAVSPIWITMALLMEDPPDFQHLLEGAHTLFAQTPKLNRSWDDRKGWIHHPWTHEELSHAITTSTTPQPLQQLFHTLINESADLQHLPAFRLHLAPVTVNENPLYALIARQHHALGDARAMGRLLARTWLAMTHNTLPPDTSPDPLISDLKVLAATLTSKASLAIFDPAKRLLSQRALALPKDKARVGRPIQHSLALRDFKTTDIYKQSQIFLSATLAATSDMLPQTKGIVRLRMPIDLSSAMGWDEVLGNTCMAIPLEFELAQVRDTRLDATALQELVKQTLREALKEGRPIANTLECLISSWIAPKDLLHRNASKGLLNETRTNTLVTTYVGNLDDYILHAPFKLVGMTSHTSTWGTHAWTLGEHMVLNTTAFEGLWDQKTLQDFTHSMATWITDQGLATLCPQSPLWEV